MGDQWPVEELFDEDYLRFFGPRLEESADAGAALAWDLAGLAGGSDVLDLACGHGRIANRLAARGARVTGLDAVPLFLDRARADAAARGVAVDYVNGDMRDLPWTGRFDAVVSWYTAYGYFDDDQNRAVLAGVHRALRPGGRFVVEHVHRDGLLPHWVPSTVIEDAGGMLVDQRTFDPLTGVSHGRWTIVRDGAVRHAGFSVRLFGFTELRAWLLAAGFRRVDGHAGDGGALTLESRRMILVAQA